MPAFWVFAGEALARFGAGALAFLLSLRVPAARRPAGAGPDDLVVAPGYSCRSQIKDFCDGREAVHTAELLALAE